eukprot:CAMPEP_0170516004 /NCGR_PEP_ID=MMETSP0209-20121228/2362_1 /TAXON_ID=665100 ORGANISM="Litonotus pictus, Strain P1" /NCGR_SAMPLE_ID=MMETSP0209 /ASSEMBLY_ACC=CAM_ASM_000301 /LENGTH=989 /DNA_ID=CAMNT_0010800749 /DNA_START=55 /DNA_END=3024 /DNA_ORIENTATION=+
MVYSGSQPQINFSPPTKAVANSSGKYEGYSMKGKKDYTTVKKPDADYQQKIQQTQHQSQQLQEGSHLNKSANISKKQLPKYNNHNDEDQGSFTNNNNKSVSALYKKLNKLPPSGTPQENYFQMGHNNIIQNMNNDSNFSYTRKQTKDGAINTSEFNVGYNKGTPNIHNGKNTFYNNIPTGSKYSNQNQGAFNNHHAHSQNPHSHNNNNTNNNSQHSHQSNLHSVMSGTRSQNTNLIIPKQVTPVVPSNKASLIMKKIQDKPPTQIYKNFREKSADPNSTEYSNYAFNQSSNQTKDSLNVIRPTSKLAKIAENSMKTGGDNYTNSTKEEKDKIEITIKSSSIGKSQGLYNQLGNYKKDSLKDTSQNTINQNTNTTNTINQSQKSVSKGVEIISKDSTLLSNYNKMSGKSQNTPMNNKIASVSEDYIPVNNSLNINPHNTSVKPQQHDLADSQASKYSINKHESFLSKKPSKQQLSEEAANLLLNNSPENITNKNIPEHQMGKKSIKHYHQKSLSDNANVENFTSTGYGNFKKPNSKESLPVFTLELEKGDEDHLFHSLSSGNVSGIKNTLNFALSFFALEDKVEQNQIEKYVNSILNDVFKLNGEEYEFFHKVSKLGLNKFLNRLLKYYTMLAMLIKFGILEFLLNNILQKKIKTILKIFNTCMYDFLYSSLVSRLKHVLSTQNSKDGKMSSINKDLAELVENFTSSAKKYQIKNLNNLTFEYQMKVYEGKITSQLKVFLDELFSENYYISYHAAFTQMITKCGLFSLDKLVFLLNETFYTSLKVKSIENPFDFLAPGKGPSSQIITSYPPKSTSKPLTLVLDLDETLVHFSYSPSGGSFIVRPGCNEFLRNIAKVYEVMIFTAATQEYANRVVNLVDPNNEFFSGRLYRQHTNMVNGEIVKDLSKLGRDMRKIMIVDNIAKNFKLQPNNGFEIKTWTGDIFDTHLQDFDKMLIALNSNYKEDVRPLVKNIKQQLEKSQFPNYKKVIVPS